MWNSPQSLCCGLASLLVGIPPARFLESFNSVFVPSFSVRPRSPVFVHAFQQGERAGSTYTKNGSHAGPVAQTFMAFALPLWPLRSIVCAVAISMRGAPNSRRVTTFLASCVFCAGFGSGGPNHWLESEDSHDECTEFKDHPIGARVRYNQYQGTESRHGIPYGGYVSIRARVNIQQTCPWGFRITCQKRNSGALKLRPKA